MSSIKEVARLAGTSTATVSRALATPALVSEATLLKVRAAVRQAGYTPNLLARNLRRMESRAAVVILPDISNPFFPEIIRGMEEIALQRGYHVLLGETQGSPHRERAYAEMLLSHQADGLIVLNGRLPDLLADRAKQLPIVVACEQIHGANLPTVVIDNVAAAREATRHLLELGHDRIGFLTGPSGNVLTRDRLQGYNEARREAGLRAEPTLVVAGDFSITSGIEGMRRLLLLPNPPTAIVASNDEMALGALHAAKQKGLQVPLDLSIVGFDDIRFAAVSHPPLTTISQPRTEIGQHAMMMLLSLLDRRDAAIPDVILKADLVKRGSTGPLSKHVRLATPSRRQR